MIKDLAERSEDDAKSHSGANGPRPKAEVHERSEADSRRTNEARLKWAVSL